MISFQCPKCKLRFSLADHFAGKTAKCKCGAKFKVPPSEGGPAAPPQPAPSGAPARDVFISYSSVDSEVAFALCGALEGEGIQCWIAPRSINPGMNYAEAIIQGINACRAFVLVLSRNSNESEQVKFEIERAASKGKRLVPFRIDEVRLSPSLEYFLSSSHWLDATAPPVEKHFPELARAAKKMLGLPTSPPVGQGPKPATAPAQLSEPLATWQQALEQGRLAVDLSAEHEAQVDILATAIFQDMLKKGFTESDCKRTGVVLKELVNNIKVHVEDPLKRARVTVSYLESNSVVCLSIQDGGKGFDLDAALEKLWKKLETGDREHGLLRALRYGTELKQERKSGPHTLVWKRNRRPAALLSLFDGAAHVVPVVFDYETDLIRIVKDIYLYKEIMTPERFKPSFLDMLFEPIRRTGAGYIGLEVRGVHHTLWGFDADMFLRELWRFRETTRPPKKLILFADTEREDHEHFRTFQEAVTAASGAEALEFFEDGEACLKFVSEKKP